MVAYVNSIYFLRTVTLPREKFAPDSYQLLIDLKKRRDLVFRTTLDPNHVSAYAGFVHQDSCRQQRA